MLIQVKTFLVLLALFLSASLLTADSAHAQGGHGPVFSLATPTLPRGAWNLDATLMSAARTDRALMSRQTIRYGLTPDLQLNLSVPLPIERIPNPPNTRIGSMMGGIGGVEAMAIWRFHTQYLGVGKRFESSLLVSGIYSIQEQRGRVNVGPGVHVAAVTGYASRTVYAWGGGGYQHYFSANGDRIGDLFYLTGTFAWRPPFFRRDYPKPDVRFFIESIAEFAGHNQIGGTEVPDSGGEKVFVGPTFLGLYRAFGLGAGVLFPVYQNLSGIQPEEGPRFAVNVSYWF